MPRLNLSADCVPKGPKLKSVRCLHHFYEVMEKTFLLGFDMLEKEFWLFLPLSHS